MAQRPSLTSSGPSRLPSIWSRIEVWKVKSNSSIVRRKGKRRSRDARLGPVGDLLGHERGQIVTVAHALLLGPGGELGIEPAHGGQVQAAQHAVEVERGGGGAHEATSARAASSTTYSAPKSC